MEGTDWENKLTSEQYRILRQKATEAPFSGKYDPHFEKGEYKCAGCGQVIFDSNSKFVSGCGWPAFDQAVSGTIKLKFDDSLGMNRTEVACGKCGGHLGHVFDDGPKETTGKRYCINSIALDFKKRNKNN